MTELRIVKRKNRDGIDCVAPFIEGHNVWDIPKREWTPSIQQAIISAYDLGIKHSVQKMQDHLHTVLNDFPNTSQEWDED